MARVWETPEIQAETLPQIWFSMPHQLRRVISYANFGKLRFKTEYEQQIWGDAARIAMLSLVSPVAWQHINFYGRYEFNKQPEFIDMKAILQQLMQIPL